MGLAGKQYPSGPSLELSLNSKLIQRTLKLMIPKQLTHSAWILAIAKLSLHYKISSWVSCREQWQLPSSLTFAACTFPFFRPIS